MRRERAIDGDEQDWVCKGWRRVLCYTHRPGAGRCVKRKMARRSRRKAKLAVRADE